MPKASNTHQPLFRLHSRQTLRIHSTAPIVMAPFSSRVSSPLQNEPIRYRYLSLSPMMVAPSSIPMATILSEMSHPMPSHSHSRFTMAISLPLILLPRANLSNLRHRYRHHRSSSSSPSPTGVISPRPSMRIPHSRLLNSLHPTRSLTSLLVCVSPPKQRRVTSPSSIVMIPTASIKLSRRIMPIPWSSPIAKATTFVTYALKHRRHTVTKPPP